MYQANISWQPLTRILTSMVSQGLVEAIDTNSQSRRKKDKRTKNIYQITMKGEQVIRYFRGAKELQLDELGMPL